MFVIPNRAGANQCMFELLRAQFRVYYLGLKGIKGLLVGLGPGPKGRLSPVIFEVVKFEVVVEEVKIQR